MTAGQVFDYNLMKKNFMQRNSRKQCFIKRRSREHEAQIGEKWISLWETVCIGSWKWGKIAYMLLNGQIDANVQCFIKRK